MGFFDRFRKGRLFFGKSAPPPVVVAFFFKGTRYILEEFDLEFHQEVDGKDRPDSEVKGGLITLTISQPPESGLAKWMTGDLERQSGEFRFFPHGDKTGEGSLLDITFKDAYCVSYQKVVVPKGAGVWTTLILSPRWLRIGEEIYESGWKV